MKFYQIFGPLARLMGLRLMHRWEKSLIEVDLDLVILTLQTPRWEVAR